uniref:Uncharacterized protein n=1 Tax=Arundo donax TaxID=35708 RepID=A0A0A8Z1N2_ARUDO
MDLWGVFFSLLMGILGF